MPQSTPGLRAKWRVDRAVKAGRPINPEDLKLMQAEGMDTPQNLSEKEVMQEPSPIVQKVEMTDKEPLPQSPPFVHQVQTPLPQSQTQTTSQRPGDTGPSLRDTVTTANTQQLKKLTKAEKVHVDFWATEFGPLMVLVLWLVFADLDKASFYAPSPDECKAASVPLGRISARAADRLNVPDWAGDAFMTAIDMKDLGFAAMAYLERIGVLTKLQNYYSGVASMARKGEGSVGPGINSGQVPDGTNGYIDINKLGIGAQYRPI